MECFVQGVKFVCDVLSRVAEMACNVLSRAIHFCVMFCSGWQACHRIFFQYDKSFGCFVKGSKNDMFFFF